MRISDWSSDVCSSDLLMAGAEGAMQEAKGRGRNCFALFALSEEQRTRQRESISIGERMVQALRDDRIAFAYQPVVLSRTGEVSYYETLVRKIGRASCRERVCQYV